MSEADGVDKLLDKSAGEWGKYIAWLLLEFPPPVVFKLHLSLSWQSIKEANYFEMTSPNVYFLSRV